MDIKKYSWGEIRTLDLTGMSRALSPTELPSQKLIPLLYAQKKITILQKNNYTNK